MKYSVCVWAALGVISLGLAGGSAWATANKKLPGVERANAAPAGAVSAPAAVQPVADKKAAAKETTQDEKCDALKKYDEKKAAPSTPSAPVKETMASADAGATVAATPAVATGADAAHSTPASASAGGADAEVSGMTDKERADLAKKCGVPLAEIDSTTTKTTDAAWDALRANNGDKNKAWEAFVKSQAGSGQTEAQLHASFDGIAQQYSFMVNQGAQAIQEKSTYDIAKFNADTTQMGLTPDSSTYQAYLAAYNQGRVQAGGQPIGQPATTGATPAPVTNPAHATNPTAPTASVNPMPVSLPGNNTNLGGSAGSGLGAMLGQIGTQALTMYAQQQALEAMNGGSNSSSSGSTSSVCPSGTTLTQLNGQYACVGTVDTGTNTGGTTAECVTYGNTMYCPNTSSNNCSEDGRQVIRINSATYCTGSTATTTTSGTTTGTGTGSTTGTSTGTTTGTTTTVNSVSDATVRSRCTSQIAALAAMADVPTCLMTMAFQTQSERMGSNQCIAGEGLTQNDVFGYDGTRQMRMMRVKAMFDAGKVDAVNGRDTQATTSAMPAAYRQGYACGDSL